MDTQLIEPERVRKLVDAPPRPGEYVLYWMQNSHRAEHNPALEFAARRATDLNLPLLVCFGLTDDYPGANLRHYRFMLEGLAEVKSSLERRGIAFTLRSGEPDRVAAELAEDAAAVVVDRGYMRLQLKWRASLAAKLDGRCELTQVEGDVVVPVDLASDKREYAARTIRPKIIRAPRPVPRRTQNHAGGMSTPGACRSNRAWTSPTCPPCATRSP